MTNDADDYRWDSPAKKARDAARGLAGDFALHAQDIIDLAQEIGEKVYDENGHYIGLTHTRVMELMRELHTHRTGDAWTLLTNTSNARAEELTVLRVRVAGLRRWLNDNTTLRIGDEEDPIAPTIKLLDATSTMARALWPHLLTMWGNVQHVLRDVGVLPKPSNTGDIYPVTYVPERPK